MSTNDSILLIDEDPDDHRLISDAHKDLGISNTLISFIACEQVVPYLRTQQNLPKLIICNYRFRTMNGLDLRREILNSSDLRLKEIPFVIWSSVIDSISGQDISELRMQGVYLKPSTYGALLLNYNAIIARFARSQNAIHHAAFILPEAGSPPPVLPVNIFSSCVDMN